MSYRLPDSALFARTSREMHPGCEMARFAAAQVGPAEARNYYFASGHAFVQALVRALERRDLATRDLALLDFGAGFGRMTRHLVQHFGDVTVCDLEEDMLGFCQTAFGTHGLLSSPDPERVELGARYDVVCSVSLLTHVPPPRWARWLEVLWSGVKPGGALVFTIQPPSLSVRFEASGRGQIDPWCGALGGTAVWVMERPYTELDRRLLQVFGARLTLDRAAHGSRCRGVLAFRTDLRSSTPPVEVTVGVSDAAVRTGFAIKAAGWRWHPALRRLEIEARFDASVALVDVPLGPLDARLVFATPTTALVEGKEPPSLELWPEQFADAGPEIWFEPINETDGRLDPAQYGATTITPSLVRERLARLPEWSGSEHFAGGAFDLYQDVFIAHKQGPRTPS